MRHCQLKQRFAFRLLEPGFVRRKLLPLREQGGILADSLKCNPASVLRSSLQGSKSATTFIVAITKAAASPHCGQAAADCMRGDM